jgi:hypothetical protein
MEEIKLKCQKIAENSKIIYEIIGGKEPLVFIEINKESDVKSAYDRIMENNRKIDKIVTNALEMEDYGAREYFYLDFEKNPKIYEKFNLKGDSKAAFAEGFKTHKSAFVEFVRRRYYSI